jgi:hypothetical protein
VSNLAFLEFVVVVVVVCGGGGLCLVDWFLVFKSGFQKS